MRKYISKWIGFIAVTATIGMTLYGIVQQSIGQAQIPAIKQWAESLSRPQIEHPKIPQLPQDPRPIAIQSEISWTAPVAVHATHQMPWQQLVEIKQALEQAYFNLSAAGWKFALDDMYAQQSMGFDLYVSKAQKQPVFIGNEGPRDLVWFDSARSFAIVDVEKISPEHVASCGVFAMNLAALRSIDPAESQGWLYSSAAMLTRKLTGDFRCGQIGPQPDIETWTTLLGDKEKDDSAWLSQITALKDGGNGNYLFELWQRSRQHSEPPESLETYSHLWRTFYHEIKASDSEFFKWLEPTIPQRIFTTESEIDASMSIADLNLGDLPHHLDYNGPALQSLGAVFATISLPSSASTHPTPMRKAANSQLQIWLTGEAGVYWSLTAIKMNAQGREVGRLQAPPRKEPTSYLLIELPIDTTKVIVVVSNLSWRPPDPNIQDHNARSFRIVINHKGGSSS